MGVTRAGRFAAITNFRNPAERKPVAPSRGQLVSSFLDSDSEPAAWLATIAPQANEYNGFSMLAGDAGSLCFFSNRDGAISEVEPGVHGLSNHLLDTPWPKVEKGKSQLAGLLAARERSPDARLRVARSAALPRAVARRRIRLDAVLTQLIAARNVGPDEAHA